MKILIPLLSKAEADPEFLEKAVKKAKEIILLLVVDTGELSGEFGFATHEIKKGTELMEEIKKVIGKKRKTAQDLIEWGDTVNKITSVALRREVDKIVLKKQDNHWFKNIVEELEKNKNKVEVL